MSHWTAISLPARPARPLISATKTMGRVARWVRVSSSRGQRSVALVPGERAWRSRWAMKNAGLELERMTTLGRVGLSALAARVEMKVDKSEESLWSQRLMGGLLMVARMTWGVSAVVVTVP